MNAYRTTVGSTAQAPRWRPLSLACVASSLWLPLESVAEPAAAAPTQLAVERFEIQGNHALSTQRIEEVLARVKGPSVDPLRLRGALEELQGAYRELGYPQASLVIPRQRVTDGTIILRIEEGPGKDGGPAAAPPVVAPAVSSASADVSSSGPTKGAAPAEPTFEVRRYEVTGNTVLAPEVVERVLADGTGAAVSFGQIQRALGALQLAYRERGYATVSVGLPQQQLTNATVKVQVSEGVLTDVRVVGNRHFSTSNVVRALPSLRTNELLNSRVFQRELDLANQNRDRQIYPTLGPGPEPGTSALTLRVKDRLPVHGRVEINNHATPGTPEWRINTSVQYLNLWQLEHQVGFTYGFTPERFKEQDPEPDYLLNRPLIANVGAYYRLPLGGPSSVGEQIAADRRFGYDEATRQFRVPPAGGRPDLTLFGSVSSSDTGIQYGPAKVVSQTPLLTIVSQDTGQNLSVNESAGARLGIPLAFGASERQRLGLSVGVDLKRYSLESFNTNNFLITTVVTNAQGSQTIESRVASPQPVRRHEVTYLPVSASLDYSATDARGTLAVSVGGSVNALGNAEDFGALGYSRDADAVYARGTLTVTRDQKLWSDWSLLGRIGGQLATGPLLSNEQFAVGGLGTVRGYYEGDEYGDQGWFGSLELRTPFLQERVPVGPSTEAPVWLRGSAFVDAGQRFLLDDGAGGDTARTLLGAGFGVSANLNNRIDLRILVGWPLIDTPNSPAGEPRASFSLGGQF